MNKYEEAALFLTQFGRYAKLALYTPYPKQLEFHNLGKICNERALIAGNQTGKSQCAAAETAFHLTGDYPLWWDGHRFNHPIQAWTAAPTSEKARDVMQTKLFGHYAKPEELGTGFIPKDALTGRPSLSRGVTFAFDTASVKWKDRNGKLDDSAISTLTFKAYSDGQLAFASDTIDLYHGDEECSLDIYIEARTRLQVKRGISYLTLTPLLGWTPLVIRMLRTLQGCSVTMGLYDAAHYTREQADEIIAGFPGYLRDTKAFGIPALGEGKIFLTDEHKWRMERFPIPKQFAKLWGIDFGGAGSGSHPFAAALIAWDRDYDIIYLVSSLKMQGMTRFQHIPRMRELAAFVPVAWPHDGHERRENLGSTDTISNLYKTPMPGMPGLRMLAEHATWPTGGFSTEAAVEELDDRMGTGRFYAFDDQSEFFAEVSQYHREKGLIVRVNDDILSALYKALMMKRKAIAVELGSDPLNDPQRRKYNIIKTLPPLDPLTGQIANV